MLRASSGVREISPEALEEASCNEDYIARGIALEVAEAHAIDVETLLGRSQSAAAKAGRRVLFQRLKERRWSYSKMGRFAGGRGHKTVMMVLGDFKES